MRTYRAGTLSLTAASAVIVGVGTQFLANVAIGDIIPCENGQCFEVVAVPDDTHITVDTPAKTTGSFAYAALRFVTAVNFRDLSIKIEQFLSDRQTNLAEFTAWMTGTATGGVNADGRYPMTDRFGNVGQFLCPAALEAGFQGATASRDAAAQSAAAALASKNAAGTSETNALASKNAAAMSATTATNAATSATASQTSATSSASTASAAATTATNASTAATASQSAAAGSATSAGTSATNAANSAAAALASKNAAGTSETNAGTSATTASNAATSATASKNAAGTSETNALASKNAAATSATNAGTSETNALASKNAAAGSATAAATSASQAATSADRVNSYVKVSSPSDITAGSLLTVGYMGVGAKDNAVFAGTALNPDSYTTGGVVLGQFTVMGENLTGYLAVSAGSNNTICGQQFLDASSGAYLTRIKNSGNWGSWVRHTGTHSVTSFNIDAVASFVVGGTERFFSTPETSGTLPFQYGFVRFLSMANNNFKQIAYEGVNVTATGSHIATRTYFNGAWSPWVKALNTGDYGLGGENIFEGNVDTIVSIAPVGFSSYRLTANTTGPFAPALSSHAGGMLEVIKNDGNTATVFLSVAGAVFIRGVSGGAWTTGVWNLVYNSGNMTNPVDAARWGVMDTQVISGWRVVRFYNGFAICSAPGGSIALAANEAKSVAVNVPISFSDYGKCSVTVQLIAQTSWDHYGAIQQTMYSAGVAQVIIRNGAGAQNIVMQNLTVMGFYK